jgi:hypothetical protein
MNIEILFWIAVCIGIAMEIWFFIHKEGKKERAIYQKNASFFSPEEQILFAVLKRAIGDEYEIFSKIPVADLVISRSGQGQSETVKLKKSLLKQLFSFVLCNKTDMAVACAIRLEEPEPDPLSRELQSMCDAASLPLVQIASAPYHNAEEIRRSIHNAIRLEPSHTTESHGRREPRISSFEGLGL